jgi:hypothetical protein
MRTNTMNFKNRFATSGLFTALLLGLAGCPLQTPTFESTPDGGVTVPVSNIVVMGALSLDLGAETTYTATVMDSTGKAISGATVAWSTNGTVSLSNPGQTQAASVKVKATGVGAGVVSAMAGGRTGQVAVTVSLGSGSLTVGAAGTAPLPAAIAVNQSVSVKAQYTGANSVKADAKDATWTATGACTVTDQGNGLASVRGTGMGKCTLTATAMSKMATAMFDVVNITAVKVTGDQTALKLGGTRTFTGVALSGTTEVPSVQVTWAQTGTAVVTVAPSATMNGVITVTGTAVGQAMLVASAGASTAPVTFAVEPVTLLAAATTRVLMGGSATVTVTPMGTGGVVGRFAAVTGVTLVGAAGFETVGPATLTSGGLVTFELTNATAPSPAVTATFGGVTSNALAFTIATVQTVTIDGPHGPVRVGSSVDVSVIVKDAQGMAIGGGVAVTWADANGVLVVPTGMTAGFTASAAVAKLGTSALIATVRGVASAALAVPGVPGSVTLSSPSPSSVPVGGTATMSVTVLDVLGAPIAGVPVGQVTVASADATKVTVGAGTAGANNTFQFTATGVALAAAPGVALTATWTGGVETVMSMSTQLIVAAGMITWTGGTCTASPTGARTWHVSGFQGATAGANAVVYDIFAASGAAATTASTKVAMDGAAGVAKDVTVASIAADWRFGVVARASDGATSALVACTRGATVASSVVAGNAIVLGGSAAYADDTSMPVSATNPRPLVMVSTATSKLDRTAPRLSLFGGGVSGFLGIGIRDDGTQVVYKRLGAGQGADASVLPVGLAVAKTDASNGVCTSRGGITAFELAGKTTAAGALTSFALYTSTATATGDVGDCALNVLAFREGATKTIASGVDRVAAFGDHRLGYTFGGALFDVDLVSTSKVPRQLADNGLDAGSLIAAANPTTGTAGAIEAAAIYVLSPTGVVSRYVYGAPPLAAPVASVATASLAGADGLVAADATTLYVTVGGLLKVVNVSGAGPLALVVTARDYSSLGALSVTLGSSAAASP